jgi:hypothetical protein
MVYPMPWKRPPLFLDGVDNHYCLSHSMEKTAPLLRCFNWSKFAPHLAAKTYKENSFLLIRYRENGQRMKKKISGPSIVLLDILKNEF